MSQFIKITFHQIVTEIKWHQKWQFDKTWFYKLLCDSLLNSLVQFWVLRLPIGLEIGTGVPPGKSLIVTPTIWRSIPTVHMNRQTLTGPEKYPPPPLSSNILTKKITMQIFWYATCHTFLLILWRYVVFFNYITNQTISQNIEKIH